MNEELFNEAAKSNVLTKKLIDQLQESMTYSSISFINWTIEVLTLICLLYTSSYALVIRIPGDISRINPDVMMKI